MYDYGEACPISRATSVLCERWTLQIVREFMLGATRFSEFQKYLPKISPTLLNARLRMLVDCGLVVRKRIAEKRGYEYQLAPAGKALEPVVREFGKWGMNWVYDGLTDEQLNVVVLMREIGVFLDTRALPSGDTVIQFIFADPGHESRQYLLVHDHKREVCDENPGHEVDVYLRASLRTFTQIWWGEVSVRDAVRSEALKVTGAPVYTRNVDKWFPVSSFAGEEKHALERANAAASAT